MEAECTLIEAVGQLGLFSRIKVQVQGQTDCVQVAVLEEHEVDQQGRVSDLPRSLKRPARLRSCRARSPSFRVFGYSGSAFKTGALAVLCRSAWSVMLSPYMSPFVVFAQWTPRPIFHYVSFCMEAFSVARAFQAQFFDPMPPALTCPKGGLFSAFRASEILNETAACTSQI